MLASRVRRFVRDVQHDFWPQSPELAILNELERRARSEPRRTAGTIAVPPYRFEYVDALSTWPQWDDIFVHSSVAFRTPNERPRILDCGANVGLASLFFRRAYPGARITAFEADPALAALCARNLSGEASVDVRQAAVWIDDGDVDFVCEGTDSGAIASLHTAVSGTRVHVRAERLRQWLDEPVDLLKLDIEGAELPVLTDCRERLRNVGAMIVEVHEFNPGHRQTGALLDLLEHEGFMLEMRSLASLPWRDAHIQSPFPGSSAMWVATVLAWRP
jgi:FkbM family methyltransferase